MELTELLGSVGASFARHRLPFMVVGGAAVSAWTSPRLTRDVDVFVLAAKRDQARLRQALLDAGARPTSSDLRLLFEKRRLRLRTSGPWLDVHLATSPHDRAAMGQAVVSEVGSLRLPLAAPEDLVLHKLAAGRGRDLDDVDALIRGVRDLDRDYIGRWTGPLEERYAAPVADRWESALRRAGER